MDTSETRKQVVRVCDCNGVGQYIVIQQKHMFEQYKEQNCDGAPGIGENYKWKWNILITIVLIIRIYVYRVIKYGFI